MRHWLAQIMELAGFALVTTGVYLAVGLAAACIVAGVLMSLAAVQIERGVSA